MAESICVGCATKGAEIEQLRAELAALKADSASLEAPEPGHGQEMLDLGPALVGAHLSLIHI